VLNESEKSLRHQTNLASKYDGETTHPPSWNTNSGHMPFESPCYTASINPILSNSSSEKITDTRKLCYLFSKRNPSNSKRRKSSCISLLQHSCSRQHLSARSPLSLCHKGKAPRQKMSNHSYFRIGKPTWLHQPEDYRLLTPPAECLRPSSVASFRVTQSTAKAPCSATH
jgi:hypothetical protein